jgi:hypothetical protein
LRIHEILSTIVAFAIEITKRNTCTKTFPKYICPTQKYFCALVSLYMKGVYNGNSLARKLLAISKLNPSTKMEQEKSSECIAYISTIPMHSK